jgi:hypothetical protein
MAHVFAFEQIDDTLDLVPIAGRRALDRAGLKVSLAAWRAAPLAVRRALVAQGAAAAVDAPAVRDALEAAEVPTEPIPATEDPSADAPPAEIEARVSGAVWRALGALDRYALAKVARGKTAEETLPRALAEIAPLSSHVDARGAAHMVDVGDKEATARA